MIVGVIGMIIWVLVGVGCYICIIFIVLCKGDMWVERVLFGGERYERDSVIIFDMGIYVGVLGWILLGIVGVLFEVECCIVGVKRGIILDWCGI